MLQLKFPQNVSSFAQFLCIFNKNLATEKNIAGQFFTAQDLERKGNCFPFFFSLAIHWRPMFCAACGRSENLYRLTVNYRVRHKPPYMSPNYVNNAR